MPKKKIIKDADTGGFASKKDVRENKAETYEQTVWQFGAKVRRWVDEIIESDKIEKRGKNEIRLPEGFYSAEQLVCLGEKLNAARK